MSDDSSTRAPADGVRSAADQRRAVRDRYAEIATRSTSCCGDSGSTACCPVTESSDDHTAQSRLVGYSADQLDSSPDGANLGLGCGTPTTLARLTAGETVLDLGSGAGFDCFLAAEEVGDDGHVIGVDMTPEMVERARENASETDASTVDFRLGEIEHLPVADASVDVIISNCVVNLSPAKSQVFEEAFRVLRPGGRLAISDVVLTARLPPTIERDPKSVAACVGGASSISELEAMLEAAGFESIAIDPKADSDEFIREWDDERDLSEYVVSATIEAQKPDA